MNSTLLLRDYPAQTHTTILMKRVKKKEPTQGLENPSIRITQGGNNMEMKYTLAGWGGLAPTLVPSPS